MKDLLLRVLKQRRRGRQRKRYFKLNIWETVTILLLLIPPRKSFIVDVNSKIKIWEMVTIL